MITIITGNPGMGKTALAVSMLLEEKGKRPLFVMGVTDLMVEHEKTPPINEWVEHVAIPEDPTLTRPCFTFPPNSIILIDEAQNVYRPRASASKVPDIVAAFETHRHTGVDFWLITQNPTFLDRNVTKLCDRHVHLDVNLLGKQTLYEWTKCADVSSKTELAAASTRPYKPPKHVFGLYKSATLHTKTKRRIPWQVWAVAALLVCIGLGSWYMFGRVSGRVDAAGAEASQALGQVPPGVEQGVAVRSPSVAPAAPPPATAAAFSIVEPTLPRIVNRPETAPMYDGMRPVTNVPRIAACIANAQKCSCYTDQATAYPTDEKTCRDFIANPPFDPYQVRDASPRRNVDSPGKTVAPGAALGDESLPGDDSAYSVPDGIKRPNLMVTPDRIF